MRLSLFALFLLGIGLMVTMTDHEIARYSKYKCQHRLVYGQTGDVNLITIGSSRSLVGVDAPILSDKLGGGVVYNLAKNWRGQGINYTFLRDAITTRSVKYALVEANLPEGQIYHAHFFVVGKISDWWDSFRFRATATPVWDVLGITLEKLVERIVEQGSLALTGDFRFGEVIDVQQAKTGYCRQREESVRQGYLDQQKERYFKYYEGKSWSWKFEDEKAAHDFGFFKEMVSIAKAHGTQLAFYHINQAYYSTLDPEFAAVFEKEVGVPLLIPPPSLTREVEEMGGYADTTHMTADGRAHFTRWLADSMLAAFGNDGELPDTSIRTER